MKNEASQGNAVAAPEAVTRSEKKVRINFDVSRSVNEALGRLVGELETTKSDFLRRALDLMELAVEEKSKGNQLAIVDKDLRVLTRIVGI